MRRPEAPIYIVSKGRAESRLTVRALERMSVPYHIIVEPQEVAAYGAVIDRDRILVLDPLYQRVYDTCDRLGDEKSKGPGAARNFAWDHSVSIGAAWHWVMDDNIRDFFRLNHNKRRIVEDGTIFRCMEDFCARYRNIAMAGPNYIFFAKLKQKIPPFIINTRIYSCNLIRNDTPFRWRGRYNEDTDLSLRMLKAQWCTVQFNAFLQGKVRTQTLKGGNTDAFYSTEGTAPKSAMLARLHPDVCRLTHKFGRPHHEVHYHAFKHKLVRRDDAIVRSGVDDYEMSLIPYVP